MKICQNCNETFEIKVKIKGKYKYLYHRKYCLKCSPFKQYSGPTILAKLGKSDYDTHSVCPKCKKKFPIKEMYKGHSYCKPCLKKHSTEWARKVKLECIEYKGGKCIKCNYDKCPASFDFHHRDPTKKDMNINAFRCAFNDEIKKELDKCDLLCSNCHRELHYKEL